MAKLLTKDGFVEVIDIMRFVEILNLLKICHVTCTQSLPASCKLQFDNQSINVIQNNDTRGCNLEIEVDDLNELYVTLNENKIEFSGAGDAIFFKIDSVMFEIKEIKKTRKISFEYDGKTYLINEESPTNSQIQLPDGRVLEITGWSGSLPQKPRFRLLVFAQAELVEKRLDTFTFTMTKHIDVNIHEIHTEYLPDGRKLIVETHIE